jgi:hypothetical protein
MSKPLCSQPLPMRARLFFIPAAVAAGVGLRPTDAWASYDFLTQEEAQQLIFPGATFTPAHFEMTDAQIGAIERDSGGARVWRRQVKLWKTSTGGWFYLDQVLGRDDRITYALGLDADGKIVGIEILVCDGGYTHVREDEWRKHFIGARRGEGDLSNRIPIISGVTLSCEHITEGVKRLLSVHGVIVTARPS